MKHQAAFAASLRCCSFPRFHIASLSHQPHCRSPPDPSPSTHHRPLYLSLPLARSPATSPPSAGYGTGGASSGSRRWGVVLGLEKQGKIIGCVWAVVHLACMQ
nr:hypothetical protein Iba_scaffold57553CG0010 [Ipomoea batatas]